MSFLNPRSRKTEPKKNGLQSQCRECKSQTHIEYRQRHPYPRKKPKSNLTKKEYDHKYYLDHREHILQQVNQYRESHKEQLAGWHRSYYEANLEQRLAYAKKYRTDNAERIAEYKRQWRVDNVDYVRRMRTEWRARNPERARMNGRLQAARRRVLLLMVGGKFTIADLKYQYECQHGKCYWCDKDLHHRYEIDHYIPVTRGGGNDPSNIVLSCRHCNRVRSNKLPIEWLREPFRRRL